MATIEFKPSLIDEITEFLVTAPSPAQVIAFHPSPQMQARASYLLEQNRQGSLSPDEIDELDECMRLTHFMRVLKAKAYQKLQSS